MKKSLLVLIFCTIPAIVFANEVDYKIGPLLHKQISPPQSEQKPMLFQQYDSSEPSIEGESEDFIKIIVVMDRHHLSDLPQSIIDELETKVTELGGYIGNHAFNRVQVFMPVGKIKELAEWEEIRLIKLPTPPGKMGGSVQSEGLSIGNINNWHDNGLTGNGVRVGVLDIGFSGYGDLIGFELPENTTAVYTGSNIDLFYSSKHGTACAEIIHDVAPDAALYLINAADVDVEYVSAVNWLKQQNVDIISSSIGYDLLRRCRVIYELLNSSYLNVDYWISQAEEISRLEEQINHTVSQTVGAGVTWSQAANNNGRQRWKDNFNDTDNDGFHNFSDGSNYNEIILPPYFQYGKEVYVVMGWGADSDSITNDDYDLKIVNEYGSTVTSSIIDQFEIPLGMEACRFTPISGRKYYLKIERYWATIQEIIILVGDDNFAKLEEYSPEKTVLLATPSANPDVISVGAIPYYTPYVIEDFSGQGPGEDGIIKPDLVAPDAVSTVSYGSPFYGTSAAAPHVAGVSALVKQKYPSYSPQQIKSYLASNALDLGAHGKDNVYGSGLVQLPNIINCTYSISPTSGDFTSGSGSKTVTVTASSSSCPWTTSESLSWASLTPTSGTGSRNVMIFVSANTGAARSGSVNIAGKTYTINQAASLPNLTPYKPDGWSDKIVTSTVRGTSIDAGIIYDTDKIFIDWAITNIGLSDAGGFTSALFINDIQTNTWATSDLNSNYYSYITDYDIGSLPAGQHSLKIVADINGTVSESNEADNDYTKNIIITQACTYSISSTNGNFPAAGGTDIVTVTTSEPECTWIASESLSWVALSPTSGSGNGDVTITVSANGGSARNGSVSIAGQDFTINQAAVAEQTNIVLTNTSQNHTVNAGSDIKIYGTSSSNQITLEVGAKAELINNPGENNIQIQSSSDLFSISRSGTVVLFDGPDGTILKIPASKSLQTINFNDRSFPLRIYNNRVMLDDQEITTSPETIESI